MTFWMNLLVLCVCMYAEQAPKTLCASTFQINIFFLCCYGFAAPFRSMFCFLNTPAHTVFIVINASRVCVFVLLVVFVYDDDDDAYPHCNSNEPIPFNWRVIKIKSEWLLLLLLLLVMNLCVLHNLPVSINKNDSVYKIHWTLKISLPVHCTSHHSAKLNVHFSNGTLFSYEYF